MQQQIQLKPIRRILCPYCQKHYLVLRTERTGLNFSPFITRAKEEKNWHCPECISYFPENYFDVYPQFEKFVERKE